MSLFTHTTPGGAKAEVASDEFLGVACSAELGC